MTETRDSGTAATPVPEVFISYHRDLHLAQAHALHQALVARGVVVFKDDRSLPVGERWMAGIDAALNSCRRFAVLLGPRGLERWVGAETAAALNRHFGAHAEVERPQIVPVLMPEAPDMATMPLLGLFQGVRWTDGEPPAALLEALTRPRNDLPAGDSPPPDALLQPDVCPWVGLAAFQKTEARRFFGRERDVLAVLDRLGQAPHRSAPYHRWLHIVGGSGSGKSSLMRAGLLPLAEQGALSARTGRDDWVVTAPMLPGVEPLVALAEVLAPALERSSLDLLEKLRHGLPETLRLWLLDALGSRPAAGVLLVIDQFEELFTLSPADARARFDLLLHEALAAPDGPLHLVSTCRSDYQHRLADDLPRLAGLLNTLTSLYTLTPMDRAGLAQAITAPARLGRLSVAPQLVQALLDDADADPTAALPLVQHAMETLWLRRRPGATTLLLQDYEALGRLGGILAAEADALIDSLGDAPSLERRGALELLSALAHFHPEGRHTRQSLTWVQACRQAGQGFGEAEQARGGRLIDALSGQRDPHSARTARLRLLTVSGSAADAHGDDARRVDLIHEALLRCRPGEAARPYWPRLVEYLNAHKDRDLLRQNLGQEAQAWSGWSRRARLVDGPGGNQLRRYQAVQYLATGTEQDYLQSARHWARGRAVLGGSSLTLLGLVLVLPMVFQNEIARWLTTDEGQDTVMVLRWGRRSPPIPHVEPVPLGEFDYGCKPGRDDKEGLKCPEDEAWRHVDLRQTAQPCIAFGKFEVTLAEYDYFVWQRRRTTPVAEEKPSYPRLAPNVSAWNWRSADIPVVNVSHRDATAYARWLSELTRQTWRLPTEEEWEYAARAPGQPDSQDAAYWWGPELPKERSGQSPRANCEGCDARFQNRIAPAGSYPSNTFGLHDTAGSAWEWTSSVYAKSNRPIDPKEEEPDSERVLRGGSWDHHPVELRASVRYNNHPGVRDDFIGFRVCRASPVF